MHVVPRPLSGIHQKYASVTIKAAASLLQSVQSGICSADGEIS